LDTKQIRLDVTDPGLEIKEREAAKPSCPKPPKPKNGRRPIVKMILRWNEKERIIRALLDWGASIPVLSKQWAIKNQVPTFQREKRLMIETFAGSTHADIGLTYSYPLRLQHRKHFSVESFEITPTDLECDVILPFWWIAKHPPSKPYGPPENIRFPCKNCTKEKADEFSVEYDNKVMHHSEALVVGSISTTELDCNPLNSVPDKFKKWTHIMSKEAAKRLPEHTPYDHAIDLKTRETPPWGPWYAFSEKELEVLREWLKEMLETGKIRPSKSPAAAPILFVPKAHGRGLRLCVDYRGINKITIANRYPLPIMSELQDRVRDSKIFTKIDLKNGYHLIRIKEGDEWKTAFRCRYGLYEFLVMPFGLTNAPASFQDMMNHILKDL
jgi:hypothetical protein